MTYTITMTEEKTASAREHILWELAQVGINSPVLTMRSKGLIAWHATVRVTAAHDKINFTKQMWDKPKTRLKLLTALAYDLKTT